MAARAQQAVPSDIRSRILSAAFGLVEGEGVAAMTQPRVAAAAGLRQSHLTYYFPRRADLLLAVLAYSHQRASEAVSNRDPFDRMAALLFDEKRARFFLAVMIEAGADPTLRPILASHLDHFRHEAASVLGRHPDDAIVGVFIDQVRGAMIRSLLLQDPMTADDLRQLASRLLA